MEEIAYSDKRTSLHNCNINYGCKKFYNTGQLGRIYNVLFSSYLHMGLIT